MSLKYQIDSLEGLDESIAKLYKQDGDVYKLNVEGVEKPEDVAGLKSALQKERDAREVAEKAQRDAEKAAAKKQEEADNAAAKKAGDVEALEKSWGKKLEKLKADKDAEIANLTGALEANTIESNALKLASTLAVPKSADVLMPHIKSRLRMEIRDGKAHAIVLGTDGKPSALTLDELGKEIASDERFAPIIVGSNGSGGGSNGAGGGSAKTKTTTRSQFDAMSQHERAAFAKDNGKVVAD